MSPCAVKDSQDRYDELQCYLYSETEPMNELLKCCYDPSHLLNQENCHDDEDDDQSDCCFDYCCFDNCVDVPDHEKSIQETLSDATSPDRQIKLETSNSYSAYLNRDGRSNLSYNQLPGNNEDKLGTMDLLASMLPCAASPSKAFPQAKVNDLRQEDKNLSQSHHHHMHFEDQYNGNVVRHDIIIPSNIHTHLHSHSNRHYVDHEQVQPAALNHHHHHHHHQHHQLNPTHAAIKEEENHKHKRVKLAHGEPSNFISCKWNGCNDELDSSSFNQHILDSHIKAKSDTFDCEWKECFFSADNLDDLLLHAGLHLGESPVPIETLTDISANEKPASNHPASHAEHTCLWVLDDGSTCNEQFMTTTDLTNHVIDVHVQSKKSEYTCRWKDCTRELKPFMQRQKIIRHLNTHTKHKPFVCHYCLKSFSLELMLEQHLRTHTGETPFKCNVCGKEFKTSSSFTIHQRIHTGEKPLKCQICGKKFRESSNLNKHMKTHTRKFKCECCMKSFDDEAKFKKHQALCQEIGRPILNCSCLVDQEIGIKVGQ
ncbi:hypothetical protein KL915_004300 [Ogataea haglerorum]|nr:hypothetical protein KL915_004300 [Ogataea haglerorum]